METKQGDKHQILIVDDNPNNLFSLHELIHSNFSVDIIEANSGFEALRIINEKPVDLCLMDVQMPEMDGFETAKLVKGRPKTAHIPIIFITAFDPNKNLMEKGLEAGGLDYLSKPIDDVQLVHMLHMYLRFIERERNINHELESKVLQRTRELQNANYKLQIEVDERKRAEIALTESQKSLHAANAAKDKFFSIIAHDLRNPFNTIIGFSNVLRDSYKELDQKEITHFIELINDSAINAYNLLSNLLDWARSQTNTISFMPMKIDIGEIIGAIIMMLSGDSQKKSITVTSSVPDGLIVKADNNMIATVIRNLLTNAIKFTRSGGEVKVTHEVSNRMYHFIFEDNGVGIAPQDLDKLFSIDTKVATRGTADEPGTGLGLILCREFIGKNNGFIRAESEQGKGSRFIVSLPAVET
jgi:signal transduction histidine kinase